MNKGFRDTPLGGTLRKDSQMHSSAKHNSSKMWLQAVEGGHGGWILGKIGQQCSYKRRHKCHQHLEELPLYHFLPDCRIETNSEASCQKILLGDETRMTIQKCHNRILPAKCKNLIHFLFLIRKLWWARALAFQATQFAKFSKGKKGRVEVPKALPTPLDVLPV